MINKLLNLIEPHKIKNYLYIFYLHIDMIKTL